MEKLREEVRIWEQDWGLGEKGGEGIRD